MGRFLALILVLPALGCVEDRITVEISTRVDADGSCTRRVEYRLERSRTDENAPDKPPASVRDALSLFRLPAGPAWTVTDETLADRPAIVAEARLPSPNDIDGDYLRRRTPKGPPSRNYVSFAMDADAGTYDYQETFLDPSSPLAVARAMVEQIQKKDDAFAESFEKALGPPRRFGRSDVKRVYRTRFAEPVTREIAALTIRSVWGPRERQALETFFDHLDTLSKDLGTALRSRLPADDGPAVEEAVDAAFKALGEAIEADLERKGLPLFDTTASIHFRVTLTLPAPIVRSNGCASGDTITWEFDQDDLYGRGFEMWARAANR